jgi:hypothetical protein
MAGTLDRPDTTAPETPPQAPETLPSAPDDASRLCANCAALLSDGQDWCLECGTAQPGRIGSKPGWRPALVVVLLTTILAAGAVAAAYAALSSDAERQASAAPPANAQPVVPPAPVQAAPAPAETTPEVAAPEDSADDSAKDSASDTSDPGPSASAPDPSGGASDTSGDTSDPGGSSGTGSTDTDTDSGDNGTKPEPKPEPKTVALSPDAASTYDPFDRAGGLTGDPADAIDGRRKTAWEAPVGQDGLVNIGLLVSLEEAEAFKNVRVQAGTPGFTVVLYGSKRGTAPEGDPAQTAAWEKLDTTRDFGTDEKLSVGAGKWRYVLLWFTEQPADTKVMIPEVELRK